jgi:hypothetical protein
MKAGVTLQGMSAGVVAPTHLYGTVIRKQNSTTSPAIAGDNQQFGSQNAVIWGAGVDNIGLVDLVLFGDRAITGNIDTGEWNDAAAVTGLFLFGCGRVRLEGVAAEQCLNGVNLQACYIVTANLVEAKLCKSYGFVLGSSCTSSTFSSCSAYACGGAWHIVSCIYITINSPSSDLSDMGRRPVGKADDGNDPFPGSGGDWRNPSFVFYLAACHGLVVNAPGLENCWSQWAYVEGCEVTINNPFFYGLRTGKPESIFLQIRGVASSVVKINGMAGLEQIYNNGGSGRAIYIENPKKQRVFINGRFHIPSIGAGAAYSEGIVHEDGRVLVDLHSGSLAVGAQTAFQKPYATDTLETVLVNGRPVLRMQINGSTNGGAFNLTLPEQAQDGMLFIRARIIGSSLADVIRMRLSEVTASNGAVRTVGTMSAGLGSDVQLSGWHRVTVSAPSNRIRLEMPMYNNAERFDIQELEVIFVGLQS